MMCGRCPHDDDYHNCTPKCPEHPAFDPTAPKPLWENLALTILEEAVEDVHSPADADHLGNTPVLATDIRQLQSTLIDCTRAIVAAIQENQHDRPG